MLTHFKLKTWIAANVVKKQQQNDRDRNSEQMETNLRIDHEKNKQQTGVKLDCNNKQMNK